MFSVFNMYEREDPHHGHNLHEGLPSFAQLTERLAQPSADEGVRCTNAPPRLGPMSVAYNSPESTDSQTSMYARSPALAGSPGMRQSGIPASGAPSCLRYRDPDSFPSASAAGAPWWQPNPERHSSHYDTPRSSSPLPLRLAPLRIDTEAIHANTEPEVITPSDEDMVLLPPDMPINYGETLDALANSAIAIYDFARRCNADRHSTSVAASGRSSSTPSGAGISEVTYARLPSKRIVNMMAFNGDIIKKRMEDIKNVRRYIENRNKGEPAASGTRNCETGTSGMATRKGRKRIREHVRDADGKKTIGAPNAAGKCYNCGCTESTEWRRGPEGQRTLCNKCGLQYSKSQKASRGF